MQGVEERVLTVVNYGEDKKGRRLKNRVTIAPSCVLFIIGADEAHEEFEGKEVRKVNVMMVDGTNLELYLTYLDMMTLERAIGNYFLP